MFSKRRDPEKLKNLRKKIEKFPMLDINKADIYRALDNAKNGLGLSDKAFELLRFILKCTSVRDWCSERVPVSTVSNKRLMEELGRSRSQTKNLLRSLAEAGWIFYDDAPNYQRGYRDNYDGSDTVSGINVSPLSRRYQELCEIGEGIKRNRQEGERLHREIQNTANYIYGIVNTNGINLTKESASEYGTRAFNLSRQRDKFTFDNDRLFDIYEKITLLLKALEDELLQVHAVDNVMPVDNAKQKLVNVNPMGSTDKPQYTIQNPININVENGVRSAHKAKKQSRNKNDINSPWKANPALRGFRASPIWILQYMPEFRDYCVSHKPTSEEIIAAAYMLSDKLGINRSALFQSFNTIGRYETAIAIGIISVKIGKKEISSPGGYLRALIGRQIEGNLNLDKTLYSLQHKG